MHDNWGRACSRGINVNMHVRVMGSGSRRFLRNMIVYIIILREDAHDRSIMGIAALIDDMLGVCTIPGIGLFRNSLLNGHVAN